jgi:hypothetical protein
MVRKYDPVLLSTFKNFKEAHAETGISKSSYLEIKRKRPDLPWPVPKKGKQVRFTAEQMIQFANAKEACFGLGIARGTYFKAKLANPHLPWPKEERFKFDPAELAVYANVYDAMKKTGIKFNTYYKYRKRFPDLDWPRKRINRDKNQKDKYNLIELAQFATAKEAVEKTGIDLKYYNRLKRENPDLPWPKSGQPTVFDPAEISKFKNAKEAILATGITKESYSRLKKLYKNDFDWPKNKVELRLDRLQRYEQECLAEGKPTQVKPQQVKPQQVCQHTHEKTLSRIKNELKNVKKHPLQSLNFML